MTDEKANFKILHPKLPKELDNLDFPNDNIENDFFFSIGAIVEDLYGAIISPLQAISLSKKIGLVIKD